MPQIRDPFAQFSDRPAIGVAVLILMVACGPAARAQAADTRSGIDRFDQADRIEGATILGLADAAMAGRPVPSDFSIQWHADFLKAQQGTFVPFILTVDGPSQPRAAALLYVRAVPRGTSPPRPASKDRDRKKGSVEPQYPVDVIFSVDFAADRGLPARVIRGFLIAPGDYDLYVVFRERSDSTPGQPEPRTTVATVPLSVPDFWTNELSTSSVILADRLTLLDEPPTPEQLLERPYVIGLNDVHPAPTARFRKDEELICVFLVYNPKVTADKKFDLQVEYHFFRKAAQPSGAHTPPGLSPGEQPPERPGERYVNHTEPQRFSAAAMGSQVDPSAGQPIMAGQGVPLAGFEEGDYRLMIKVTDLLAGRTLTRDVNFSVGS